MLEYLEEVEKAERIRNAIGAVIAEAKVQNYDIKKLVGGPAVISQGAVTTQEMTDAIIDNL